MVRDKTYGLLLIPYFQPCFVQNAPAIFLFHVLGNVSRLSLIIF